VVALIELDDRLHSRIKDTRRDTMTRAAGYTTLRYNSWAKPSTGELIQTLEHLRGRKAPARVTVS
jgi:very-short-patch-repair endonuclease